MPAGGTDIVNDKKKWSSISLNYNVETIFFHLDADSAGYEIWVRQASNLGAEYGIAWWAEEAPAPKPKKVGDKVWEDSNANGIQDAGEPGVENVTVQLYTAGGMLVSTTTTDYDGRYTFEVDPGSYYVQFTAPYGKGFTTRYAGSDPALDSNADAGGRSETFTIGSSDDFTIDAGLVSLPYGSIGNFVWNDLNGNGVQDSGEPGLAGVTATLYTSAGDYFAETTTNSAGQYEFSNVGPGNYFVVFTAPTNYAFSPKDQGGNDTLDSDANASGQTDTFSLALSQNRTDIDAGLRLVGGSVGDFVWLDSNRNGLQDFGESGLSYVTVRLHTSSGTLVSTTNTDDDGYYSFTSVAPGSYYIVVVAPSGYAFTTQHVGSDPAIDSNVNASGQSGTFTVSLGQVNTTIDAGLVSTYEAVVGDFVWNDTDADGIQDAGEPGLANVNVNLYTSAGTLIAQTTTNASGEYFFTALDPGAYYIVFLAPPGLAFSPQHQGPDPALDSDADPNGQTPVFSLAAGQVNVTLDAGLVSDGGIGTTSFSTRKPAFGMTSADGPGRTSRDAAGGFAAPDGRDRSGVFAALLALARAGASAKGAGGEPGTGGERDGPSDRPAPRDVKVASGVQFQSEPVAPDSSAPSARGGLDFGGGPFLDLFGRPRLRDNPPREELDALFALLAEEISRRNGG